MRRSDRMERCVKAWAGRPRFCFHQPVRGTDGCARWGPGARRRCDEVDDELSDLLASAVTPLGLELLDLELRAALVRVVVDRVGGADLDLIALATRAVSVVLDAHDPFPGQ